MRIGPPSIGFQSTPDPTRHFRKFLIRRDRLGLHIFFEINYPEWLA